MTVLENQRLTARSLNAKLPYASEDEIEWLQQWAQHRDYSTVVIIGAGPGIMTLALLEMRNYMRIYIVDIAPATSLVAHVREAGFDPTTTIRVYLADSAAFAGRYDGGPIDLLVVDGDHSEAGVRRDIVAWLPRVVVGGLLFFHDYHRVGAEWDGIKIAVDALCADCPFVADVDSARVLRKD